MAVPGINVTIIYSDCSRQEREYCQQNTLKIRNAPPFNTKPEWKKSGSGLWQRLTGMIKMQKLETSIARRWQVLWCRTQLAKPVQQILYTQLLNAETIKLEPSNQAHKSMSVLEIIYTPTHFGFHHLFRSFETLGTFRKFVSCIFIWWVCSSIWWGSIRPMCHTALLSRGITGS